MNKCHTNHQLEEIARYLAQEESYLDYGVGYSTGALGLFFFLHKYCVFFDDDELVIRAQLVLRQTIEKALTQPIAQLCDATEFGLLMLRLFEEEYLPEELQFILAKTDELLHAQLLPILERRDFDQFTGYLAIARYFLKRGPEVALAREGLHAIIDNLLLNSQHNDYGSYWRSQFMARDVVYFGWSHGLASILLFLANYVQQNAIYQLAEVKAVLQDCVRFVLHNECQVPPNLYPDALGEALPTGTLNLCYGDIGIVYALWRAAAALEAAPALQHATKQLLKLAERREAGKCHVYDASILYGASGNMLFFNRLFQETQQPVFSLAAAYWQEQAQELSQHPGCVAGYKNYYNKALPQTYPSFFEGLAGYGLAQLEYENRDLGLLELIGY